jgi:hypothetical protein
MNRCAPEPLRTGRVVHATTEVVRHSDAEFKLPRLQTSTHRRARVVVKTSCLRVRWQLGATHVTLDLDGLDLMLGHQLRRALRCDLRLVLVAPLAKLEQLHELLHRLRIGHVPYPFNR